MPLVRRHERDGVSRLVRAPGAADAMHVGVGRIRHFEVDDRVDPVDVEAARGDVGGDEHLVSPASEPLDGRAPLLHRAIGVEGDALDARGGKSARQPIGADLRAREDEHRALGAFQVFDQPIELAGARQNLGASA